MVEGVFFLEPYVTDNNGENAMSVVRVFVTQEEADEYERQINAYFNIDPEKSEVVPVTLEDLFRQRDKLYTISKKEYDCKFRYEMSKLAEDNWPMAVDVLWGFANTVH